MAKKDLLKQDFSTESSFQVLPIVTESVDYDLDDDKEFANGDLIKYEFNLIELPFFTKDRNIRDGIAKQYNFSKNKDQYMRVIPSGDPKMISNKIPQEFDEKIFYGIMKLSREQNSDVVITDYFTLAKVSNVRYVHDLERIRDSIQRLRTCRFELNNLFYTAENSEIAQGRKDFNILQDLEEYDLKRVLTLKDTSKKELFQKYFQNRRIENILVLTLSKRIYSNIQNKAFLYFNQQHLLEIDNATARKLYLLLEKWHGWEKKDKIRRSCRFIASRIPLAWEKKTNIPGTIKYIDSAAALLKSKNLISDYFLAKTKPIEDSYIDFYFPEKTNKVIEYNRRAAAVTTGQENIVINSIEDDFIDDRQATIFDVFEMVPEIKEIYDKLPEEHKTDAVKKVFERFADKGFDYVNSNVVYTIENCSDNFPAYLNKALKEDFAADQRQKAEIRRENERKQKEKEAAAAAAEKAKNERLQNEAAEIYANMSDDEKAAFHAELKKFPFFDSALVFYKTLEAFAISQIAFRLKK